MPFTKSATSAESHDWHYVEDWRRAILGDAHPIIKNHRLNFHVALAHSKEWGWAVVVIVQGWSVTRVSYHRSWADAYAAAALTASRMDVPFMSDARETQPRTLH